MRSYSRNFVGNSSVFDFLISSISVNDLAKRRSCKTLNRIHDQDFVEQAPLLRLRNALSVGQF